ncbi:MAG: hypothetical protein WC836_17630 [Desulfobacula sp.]|jgi:hypothetical protein
MARLTCFCVATIFLVIVLPLKVFAGPDKITPYVSLKQEYSDNILFSSANEKDDFISTGTGGIVLSRKDEKTDARLDAKLLRLFYWDNDQLDSTDGGILGNWNYKMTERFGIGTKAEYQKDSRRDTDTDTTGLILSGDRERTDFSVSANYLFSELSRGEVTGGYGTSEIDEINDDEDSDTLTLNFAFTRNLSKTFANTTGLLNFSYMKYTSDVETISPGLITTTYFRDFSSDVFQLYGGFSKDITELYNVYVQAGASYTDTTEGLRTRLSGLVSSDVRSADQTSDSLGGVLATGLKYDGLYYDVGLSVSHDVRGSIGTNGTAERSAVSLEIDGKLTDEFFLTFDTSLYLNRNERKTLSDLDELTFNLQPGFRYRITDTFTLTGVYRYTSVENRQNDNTSERNLVYLMIKKDFDL